MPQIILRLQGVLARTGLSRSSIYKRIGEGTFPRQVQLGIRACGWWKAMSTTGLTTV